MAGNNLQRLFKKQFAKAVRLFGRAHRGLGLIIWSSDFGLFFQSPLYEIEIFVAKERGEKNVVDKQVLFGRTWVVDCVEGGQCRGNN